MKSARSGKKLRIAFVTCHFPPDSMGGGQIQSLRLCRTLGRNSRVVAYVRDYSGDKPSVEAVESFVIRRRKAIGVPVLRSFVDFVKGILFIRTSRREFDVFVSFHLQLAAAIVVVAARMFGTKAIISPRGSEDFDFSRWYRRMLQKPLYRNATAIFVQSERIRQEFLAQAGKEWSGEELEGIASRTHIFPNIIDAPIRKAARPGGIPKIFFVGRLVDYKGVRYLLEASKEIGVGHEVVIVGDGPERANLERMSVGLPVRFLGEIPYERVDELLKQAHVVVLPSLTENFSNVLLEALAMGIPVVATAVGGIPDMITDGENGFLVRPADAGELALRIKTLISDKRRHARMSAAATKSAKAFSPESLLPILETTLAKIAYSS